MGDMAEMETIDFGFQYLLLQFLYIPLIHYYRQLHVKMAFYFDVCLVRFCIHR